MARREYSGDPDSVGAHLVIDPGDLAIHLDSAAKAIHAVHGDGGLPTIPARKDARLKSTQAGYVHGPIKAESIELQPGTRHPAFDVVHEIGHLIDHQALGSKGYGFASVEGYPDARRIVDAIQASPESKALAKEFRRTRPGKARGHLAYLGRSDELFARAYSQYIAARGQDPEIPSALRWEQGSHYGKMTCWSVASCGPIAGLFDAMFREKGWSHD